jgi:16S rRNA (guanine527-N7)-methyltransferase
MPLVRQGGTLVAMKGAAAADEVTDAAAELRRHGAGRVEVLTLGAGLIDPPTTVVRVEATRPSRLGWGVATPSARATRSGAKKKSGKKGRSA